MKYTRKKGEPDKIGLSYLRGAKDFSGPKQQLLQPPFTDWYMNEVRLPYYITTIQNSL